MSEVWTLLDDTLSTECYSVRLLLSYQAISFHSDYSEIDPLRPHDKPPELIFQQQHFKGVVECLTRLAEQPNLTQALSSINDQQLQQWYQLHLSFKQNLGVLRQANLSLSTFLVTEAELKHKAYATLTQLNDHLCIQSVVAGPWILAGHAPSLVDFLLFPLVALSSDADLSLDDFLHIRRWVKRMHHIAHFIPMPGLLEI